MSTAKVARRYASALFDLHQEGKLDRDELDNAVRAVNDKLAARVIASPDYDKQVKAMLIKAAIKMSGETVVTRLIDLLAERGKLPLLAEIQRQLDLMIARSSSCIDVDVTVATKLDEAEKDSLRAALRKMTGSDVTLKIEQDASILGGLIVQIGDRRIDSSVRSRLEALRQAIVG